MADRFPPPWSLGPGHAAVVVGVIEAGPDLRPREAAKLAKSLRHAGADMVEISAPGDVRGRTSTGELVAAVAEEAIPVGLTVTDAVSAHLGVGAGAAWLRVHSNRVGPDAVEALQSAGRPCVIADLFEDVAAGGATPVRVELAVAGLVEGGFRRGRVGLEVLPSQLPTPHDPAEGPAETLPVVLDLSRLTDPDQDRRRGAVAGATVLGLTAGVRVVRTLEPATVRRATQVVEAIREAG